MTQSSGKQTNKLGDKRGLHLNSLKNLKEAGWNAGQSGNPDGYSLTKALKIALRNDPVRFKQLIEATIDGAIALDPAPFHEVWDRHEGKVPQPVSGSLEITHNISFVVGKGYKDE